MPRTAMTPLPQPVFNEGNIVPDPSRFKTPHPSDTAQFKALGDLLKKDVVGFDASRLPPGELFALEDVYGPHGPEVIQRIKAAGKVVFHAVGDTGASNEAKFGNEIRVADQMTKDCRVADANNRPSFFYHLGDVVYDFGEAQFYFDQFYEPYRNYPAPILAIPGNHDSFIIPNRPGTETPLTVFSRNFCSPDSVITPEAASLHRTSMTQPGVYFALDAPFVRLIGLFSNALEDPGVISSENGKWPGVPDVQLDYLAAQLKRVKTEKYKGAVLIAVHHPPFSFAPAPKSGDGTGGNHSSSNAMLRQIDTICKAQGVYPHAFLSGHAHNYQRFTRTVQFGGKEFTVPFVVCGDGGHNVNALVKARRGQPAQEPHFDTAVDYLDARPAIPTKGLSLKHYDDTNPGYLRITVDANQIKIGFNQVGKAPLAQSQTDVVTVDLASHRVVAS
jgi:hypothetical protein